MFTIAGGVVLGFVGIVLLIAGFWVAAISAVFAYEVHKAHKTESWVAICVLAFLIIAVASYR